MYDMVLFTFLHRCLKGANSNLDSTHVGAFVDFKNRIKLIVFLCDLLHLIGRDCIQSASE